MKKIKRYLVLMILAFSISNTLVVQAEETELTNEEKFDKMRQYFFTDSWPDYPKGVDFRANKGVMIAQFQSSENSRYFYLFKGKESVLDYAHNINGEFTYCPDAVSWNEWNINDVNKAGTDLYLLKNEYNWSDDEITYLVDNFMAKSVGNYWNYDTYEYEIDVDYEIIHDPESEHLASAAYVFNELKEVFFDETYWKDGKFQLPETPDDYKKLPLLTFKFERKRFFRNLTELFDYNVYVTWDYNEKEPYRTDPGRYRIQIKLGMPFSGLGAGNVDMSSLYNLTDGTSEKSYLINESYSFTFSDEQKHVQEHFGLPRNLDGFSFYIRIIDLKSNAVSSWRAIEFDKFAGTEDAGVQYEENEDGEGVPDESDVETEDDGVTGNDPNGTNTSASQDSGSDSYDEGNEGTNLENFLTGIKSIVSSLGEIPALLKVVYSWLPNDLFTLISASLAFAVVVGVVKWVL